MNRHIPATMATQHPDNACPPYWERDGDGFVSTHEETEECYSAFNDLGCEEFMWDWEGKYVDEAVVDRLFHTYFEYFKKHQLGKEKFLTFRIPNIWHERGYGLARSLMGILTAESFAQDLRFHTPPLFEVILPMTDKAENIIHIQDTFTRLATFKHKLFADNNKLTYLNVLPLFEGVNNLLECRTVLDRYLTLHAKRFKQKPPYLRLHIARSDPALNSGIVPAVVAGKVALSEFYRFGKQYKIDIYPAIGVGTLPFRGGLSPLGIKRFLAEYPGIRTVYIQSAFRYDFGLGSVKKAIKQLNTQLPKTKPPRYTTQQVADAKKICSLFSHPYQKTVESLAGTINTLSKQVPSRRERKLHIGLFGYSRGVGKKRLPRAIPFTAVLYSLGIPPEFIGTGRGLQELGSSGIKLEKYYRNFKKDMMLAGKFLNKENLNWLADHKNGWQCIKEDIEILEKYLKIELGPKTKSDLAHHTISSKILKLWNAKKSISKELIASGKI